MSSSSSDSEDENIALLKQAVDTNFISDCMFSTDHSSTNKTTVNESQNPVHVHHNGSLKLEVQSLKSQRYIEHDEIEADLKVPKSMQDFVYKKMSKRIEESIEFVEISSKKTKKIEQSGNETYGVRLLKETEPITKIDLFTEDDLKLNAKKNKKLEPKRRVIESDGYSDEGRIKMAA